MLLLLLLLLYTHIQCVKLNNMGNSIDMYASSVDDDDDSIRMDRRQQLERSHHVSPPVTWWPFLNSDPRRKRFRRKPLLMYDKAHTATNLHNYTDPYQTKAEAHFVNKQENATLARIPPGHLGRVAHHYSGANTPEAAELAQARADVSQQNTRPVSLHRAK
ncbi:MAG TPA: hypothetical protein V6C97_21555 [Oculatellaceae cyanobacterium]